ncbi:MAG: M56 family metallopeptidase, partial [Bacillota bacterium]|nr:M56 family metallopeptidase [Bacillota bacterium]
LWGIVLARLLIPFSISIKPDFTAPLSRLSDIETKAGTVTKTLNILPPGFTAAQADTTALSSQTLMIHPWLIIWLIGIGISLTVFLTAYIKNYRNLREALPMEDNMLISAWLSKQTGKQPVRVLTSDRITTPIIFGFIESKIILPKDMDFSDCQQLSYVLSHEFIHMKRHDNLWKFISVLALCVHWFNPLVWLMYVLFNRDMEIACDEKVISIHGEEKKSAYALSLIDLAEKKAAFSPLCNGFGKNAIEERIVSIMKYKKLSVFSIILAAALIISSAVVTIFASSDSKSGQINIAAAKTPASTEKWQLISRARYIQGTIAGLETSKDGKYILSLNVEINFHSDTDPVDDKNYPFKTGEVVKFVLKNKPEINLENNSRVVIYEGQVTINGKDDFLGADIKYYEEKGKFYDMSSKEISMPPKDYDTGL